MQPLKDWTSVLEWLKRPFFAFVSTGVLCGILLSNDALSWLGLERFRWIIAALFLFSICVLFSQILAVIWGFLSKWIQRRDVAASCRKRLNQLTHNEKLILKGYIDGQTRTQNFDIGDGTVATLVQAGIISRVSNVSQGPLRFPYNITDFAWDYLNENPGVLADF